jgi:hypothetical protein
MTTTMTMTNAAGAAAVVLVATPCGTLEIETDEFSPSHLERINRDAYVLRLKRRCESLAERCAVLERTCETLEAENRALTERLGKQ